MNNNNELPLTQLINVEMLQSIQDAFSDMTGMAALTTDKNGTAVTAGSNFTDFCFKYTRTSELGRSRCEMCDRNGAYLTMENGRYCSYHCHAGLMDFAAPIMANGRMVGSFIGGQILTNPPDIDKFARIADEIGVDRDKYIEAVKKVRIVDEKAVARAARFLCIIAEGLSSIAYNAYKLHVSNIELEKAAKAKSDFLANMSHEIRTPMNAVLGMTEMALREEMSPAAKEYLYQIRSSGKNLLVIINDVLDFSKIESGKLDIVEVAYEPLSVINDVASVISSRIGDKDVELIMDISPGIPRKMIGDNVRIQQIVINLLNNAVKFTRDGRVRFRLYCEPAGEDTVILKAEISDTGSGIKKEDIGKLFRSFQQVDSKRNRNIEGTGLGLAISQQLLSLMNGSISVQSEYGKGSTFSFELPQKVVTPADAIDVSGIPLRTALLIWNSYVKEQIKKDLDRINAEYFELDQSCPEDCEYDYVIVERNLFSDRIRSDFISRQGGRCIVIDDFGSTDDADININGVRILRKPVYYLNLYAAMGLAEDYVRTDTLDSEEFYFTAPSANVLVVDDNSVNLTVAKGLLDPLNMRVDTAGSAAEAIDRIKDVKYDVIFMDHMMPEVDGVEATHIIRRLMPDYANTPIIALTANAVNGAKDMFIREGMNDFVAKPIDSKEITAKLRKWLPQEKIIIIDEDDRGAVSSETELEIEGLDVKTALPMLGSESLYMAVLKEYYLTIEKKALMIEEYRAKGLIKDYSIEVHALKSSSRQIGAYELGSMAEKLELAGKEGNIELINEKTGEMLEKLKSYKGILEPLFPGCGEEKLKKSVEPIEIKRMLDELSAALEEFDTLAIDEAIENMSGYSYDSIFGEYFSKLKKAAEDYDIDLCNDVIESWKTDIVQIYINR